MFTPGSRRSAPTIRDVARRAGVAPVTVSRVINDEASVRPVTRELVKLAINELNYIPNQAARRVAGAEQIRVGLLYAKVKSGFSSKLLVEYFNAVKSQNVEMVIEKSNSDIDKHEVLLSLVKNKIDGVIMLPPFCEDKILIDLLGAAGITTVAVAAAHGSGKRTVAINDRRACHEMTRHLITLGHCRIGFIAGSPTSSVSVRRLQGYLDAHTEVGLPVEERLVAEGLSTYLSGFNAAQKLLESATPPTAIFACNDLMAAATLAVAYRCGLRVPANLTVVGFGDTDITTLVWPELTTIGQPIAEIACHSLNMLVEAIWRKREGTLEEREIVLEHTLVRRQSDAPPPGQAKG